MPTHRNSHYTHLTDIETWLDSMTRQGHGVSGCLATMNEVGKLQPVQVVSQELGPGPKPRASAP